MNDHTTQDDFLPIRIEPESPPQLPRELTSAPHDILWRFSSMPGAWPTSDEDLSPSNHSPEGYLWEINQDRAHPMHSPGVFPPQSSGTLSPIMETLRDFSFADSLSRSPQGVPPDEQEFQYNDDLPYPGDYYNASTSSLERSASLFAHPPFHAAPLSSQDPSRPVEGSERRDLVGNSLYPFLTDGNYSTTYSMSYQTTTNPPFIHRNHRSSTPNSDFASPATETPSPLHLDVSSLSSSPFNSSPDVVDPDRTSSPLIIPDGSSLTNHKHGYFSNYTYPANIPFNPYEGSGSAGLSHPTSVIHDTPSPNLDLLLSPSHALGLSHDIHHSAPPSPSSLSIYQDHSSVESGTRRHSHSSGSDHPSQRTASFSPELAKFRQNVQAESNRPSFFATSQMQPVHERPTTEANIFPNYKGTIASAATLEAAKKRRKKNALFACTMCPQKLTSKDNLNSHVDAHMDLKRFICEYCNCRFRTRSVLARHQKSKKCPASTLPKLKK